MLQKAIDFATKTLQGINDCSGKPMIEHALRMVDRVDTQDEKIIAVLHDVVGGWLFVSGIKKRRIQSDRFGRRRCVDKKAKHEIF